MQYRNTERQKALSDYLLKSLQSSNAGDRTAFGALAKALQGYASRKTRKGLEEQEQFNEELYMGDLEQMRNAPNPMEAQDNPFTSMTLDQVDPTQEPGGLSYDLRGPSETTVGERGAAAFNTPKGKEMALELATDQQNRAEDFRQKQMIEQLKNQGGGGSLPRPIPTSAGYLQFNPETQSWERMLDEDGNPYMYGGFDPDLQRGIARNRQAGKDEAIREFNMMGIGDLITEGNRLLETGVATESGLGTVVDSVAGFFGASPEGAVEASQLKAIGAALTMKMPRMEGPQSDKDSLLYQEAAARVGDSTVPADQRKAALETVKMLWAKYEQQPSTDVDNDPLGIRNQQ